MVGLVKFVVFISFKFEGFKIDLIYCVIDKLFDYDVFCVGVVLVESWSGDFGDDFVVVVDLVVQLMLGVYFKGCGLEFWCFDLEVVLVDMLGCKVGFFVVLLYYYLLLLCNFDFVVVSDGMMCYKFDFVEFFEMVKVGDIEIVVFLLLMSFEVFGVVIVDGDVLLFKLMCFLFKFVSGMVWSGYDIEIG